MPPVNLVSHVSPALTHQHLGNSSLEKLRLLVPSLSNVKSFRCKSCQLGKHTRISYGSRVNKCVAFVLVHFDIWGPSRACSTLGYFYFVTFIDNFSHVLGFF